MFPETTSPLQWLPFRRNSGDAAQIDIESSAVIEPCYAGAAASALWTWALAPRTTHEGPVDSSTRGRSAQTVATYGGPDSKKFPPTIPRSRISILAPLVELRPA